MKRIKKTIAAMAIAMTALAQGIEATAQSVNPVIPGFHPDPSVCRVGDKFYLVNSTFQYFPGVPIFESTDMQHWKQIGNVLDREEQLPLKGGTSWTGIYAPTIRYNDGTYYMITTNVGNGGNFFVTSHDPKGPWSAPIWLEQQGIDPSLYFEDGRCYMVSNPDNTIMLCEIDPKTGGQLTKSKTIWRGTGGRYPEGPHIYKKDGYYYLLISEGGTEIAHKLTIARSKKIDGPYESCPRNPIFTHCSMAGQTSQIQGTGHGDIVEGADGKWWISFLAFRFIGGSYHHLGRETFVLPVTWDNDGWPVINDGHIAEVCGLSTAIDNSCEKSFANIGHEFIYIQNPVEERYEHVGGALRLHCSPSTLTQNQNPTFIGRRMQHDVMRATTYVDATGLQPGDEAGMTIYQIHDGHSDIIVGKEKDGRTYITVRHQLKSLVKEEPRQYIDRQKAFLRIQSHKPETIQLMEGEHPYNMQVKGEIDAPLLSTEVVGGFTGAILGIFATGRGHADFHFFDYSH